MNGFRFDSPTGLQVSEQSASPVSRRRILVADDNRDAASTLGMLLEIMGHEVRVVYDGKAAIEAAAAFQPDVALLDITMPQLNGYDACSFIRTQSSNKDLLIVALTGCKVGAGMDWGQAAGLGGIISAAIKMVFPDPKS